MDAMTKPKRKPAAKSGRRQIRRPRRRAATLDLHDRQIWGSTRPACSSPSIIVDKQGHRDAPAWCAGSSVVHRGGRTARPSCSTNVVRSKKRANTTSRRRRHVLASNREIYRIGIGCRLDEIDETPGQGGGRTRSAPCIVETRRVTTSSSRARRLDMPGAGLDAHPAADLDAGPGHRAHTTLSQQHHQGDPDTGMPQSSATTAAT